MANDLIARLAANPKNHARLVRVAAAMNRFGIGWMARARDIVSTMNARTTDAASDRFIRDLPALHTRIEAILETQRREYPHYAYFFGRPYQSLGILGIFGERASEERFDVYGLADLIGPKDTVLDIGCNCGFMAVLAAFRTGCRAYGLDINPHMIDIGRAAADFLNLKDRVRLEAGKFQELQSEERFSIVFSFATHWTDDGNYRVELDEHFGRIHGFLTDGGLLIFESHCADVGQPTFYAAMERARDLFDIGPAKPTDNGTRELYLMRKRGADAGVQASA
jgi:SAM-dependent methyltransferase